LATNLVILKWFKGNLNRKFILVEINTLMELLKSLSISLE